MYARWEFFDANSGRESIVVKDLRLAHLSKMESARLEALLTRIADGRAIPDKDFKYLSTEGLWEFRFTA